MADNNEVKAFVYGLRESLEELLRNGLGVGFYAGFVVSYYGFKLINRLLGEDLEWYHVLMTVTVFFIAERLISRALASVMISEAYKELEKDKEL